MDDKIKLQRINPFSDMTLSEAEMVALAMNGEWVPWPVEYLTREEVERLFPKATESK